jgi:EmrB/QacA subfamily drug resistance transporter
MPLAATLPAAPASQTRSRALPVIVLAQLMVVLDATVVNIALPSIQTSLHFSRAQLSWVITAYALTFGGLLLLGARSGDLFGRKRTFLVGISLFTVASLAGGLATSSSLLLAARAAQGVGAALASPSALALLLVSTREGVERTRALALYTAVSIGGAAIGLVAGGVLVEWTSWRWVFYVNIPIGLVLLVLARRHLTETTTTRGSIDFAGALTSTGGMAGLVYGFTEAASVGWKATSTLVAFGTGIVLLGSFVLVERRVATPITPLRLFADRDRVFSYLARLGLVGGMFGMFFFLTQFLTGVLGYSGLATGFAFLPLSAAVFTTSQLTARFLLPRLGAKPLMVGGITISMTAVLLLTQLNQHSGYWLVLVALVLFGIGNGSAFVPLTAASLAGVDPADAGAASGLVNVMQQVGGALGLSILVTVFGADGRAQSAAGIRDQVAIFVHSADRAFLVAAVMLAVAIALMASMRSARRVRADAAERLADELELTLASEDRVFAE